MSKAYAAFPKSLSKNIIVAKLPAFILRNSSMERAHRFVYSHTTFHTNNLLMYKSDWFLIHSCNDNGIFVLRKFWSTKINNFLAKLQLRSLKSFFVYMLHIYVLGNFTACLKLLARIHLSLKLSFLVTTKYN